MLSTDVSIIIKAKDEASAKFKSLGRIIKETEPSFMALAAGSAAVAGGVALIGAKAVKMAAQFQTGMAEVSTLVDTAKVDMGKLGGAVLDMSKAVPQSAAILTKGLYQVISASVPVSKSMDVLAVASKAATAGLSDTFTAVDSITTIMNAYGMTAEDTTRISDIMFTAVRKGKTTFSELASQIGSVATPAAKAGVRIEEVSAALATMTKKGLDTANATTYLRQIIMSVLKPTSEAAEAADRLGLDFTSAALKSKGLAGFLKDVEEKTKGNSDELVKLFGNVQAFTGALTITGEGAQSFAEDLEAMDNATGATEDAFAKMMKTFTAQWTIFKNVMTTIWIKLGDQLLPVMTKLVQSLKGLADGFSNLSNTQAKYLVIIGSVVGAIAGLITVFSGILILLPSFIAGIKALEMVLTLANLKFIALQGAMIKAWAIMAAHPLVFVTAAVAGLTLGIAKLIGRYQDLKAIQVEQQEAQRKTGELSAKRLKMIEDIARKAKAGGITELQTVMKRNEAMAEANKLLKEWGGRTNLFGKVKDVEDFDRVIGQLRTISEAEKKIAEEREKRKEVEVETKKTVKTSEEIAAEKELATIKAKAAAEVAEAAAKEELERQKKLQEEIRQMNAETKTILLAAEEESYKKRIDIINSEADERTKALERRKAEEPALTEAIDAQIIAIKAERDAKIVAIETERDAKILAEKQKLADQTLAIQEETEDTRISLIENAYDKEKAILEERHQDKIDKIAQELEAITGQSEEEIALRAVLFDQLTALQEEHNAKINDLEERRKEASQQKWEEEHQIAVGFMNTTQSALATGIASMINGTKSFAEAIKGIWKSIAGFVVDQISQMIAKWLVFKALTAMVGGGGLFGGIAKGLLGSFQTQPGEWRQVPFDMPAMVHRKELIGTPPFPVSGSPAMVSQPTTIIENHYNISPQFSGIFPNDPEFFRELTMTHIVPQIREANENVSGSVFD